MRAVVTQSEDVRACRYAEHCCTATAENSDALDGDKTNDSEDPEEASSTDDVDPVADNEDSDADLDP